MDVKMDPLFKQQLDDEFDAFTMLADGAIVSLMHVQGNTTRWSPAGVELFDLSGEYIPNGSMDWGDYVHPEDRKRYMDAMGPLVAGGTQTYDLTYRVRTKDGEYGNFRAKGAVLRDASGAPSMIGGVLINQGLTENIDPVTVLPNKNAYLADLTKQIQAGNPSVSLLVGFRKLSEINQKYGYTYGNRLLQEAAWLIQEVVEERGTVYRMENGTFALLANSLTRDEIGAIYDLIRYRLQKGIVINGTRNTLSACAGLVSTQSSEINATAIYSCLTYAYEESKLRKHGELVDFNGSIHYDSSQSLDLINHIRDCIIRDCKGFALEYDPVICLQTDHMNGAESLVYWHDDQYGKISPQDFVPVLEPDYVFEELGDFILRRSLEDGVRFIEKDPAFLLCVNVYRIQLEEDYFIENIQNLLKETGFPANQLSLKLTRDCQVIDSERLVEIVRQLKELGIIVIADDFGTGYDCVGFLKSVPVDAVCMDDVLLHGIEEDEQDRNILRYLTEMAAQRIQYINIRGVNTEQLRDVLRAFPITTVQGPYYSEPLSFEQIVEKYYSK